MDIYKVAKYKAWGFQQKRQKQNIIFGLVPIRNISLVICPPFHIPTAEKKKKMEEKKCLECGEKIIGRSDKKYCNDYCRNAFNNKLEVGNKSLVRNINNALKKNYKILCELNITGKTKVSKTILEEKGFNFNLFTSIYITKTGNQYYYCYDEGYLLLASEQVLLVKK